MSSAPVADVFFVPRYEALWVWFPNGLSSPLRYQASSISLGTWVFSCSEFSDRSRLKSTCNLPVILFSVRIRPSRWWMGTGMGWESIKEWEAICLGKGRSGAHAGCQRCGSMKRWKWWLNEKRAEVTIKVAQGLLLRISFARLINALIGISASGSSSLNNYIPFFSLLLLFAPPLAFLFFFWLGFAADHRLHTTTTLF